MTRDDIIRMAREAGLGGFLAPQWDLAEELKCFAALVAAAELRRQHDRIATLEAALRQAVDALENHTAIKHPQQRHYRDEAITAAQQALGEA